MIRKRNRFQRRGVAVVETAVIMPVALMFVLGVSEFSLMLMARQSVAIAAREGARAAARQHGDTGDIRAAVDRVMTNAGYDGYSFETNVDEIDYDDRSVSVRVTLPWDRFAITGDLFGGGTFDISIETTMRREGDAPRN
ncbi:MAG: pilus assembly protein [Phycisphaerales bacterium]|nr:pilus assembly protein [Phycisphaerales bacterium]